MDVSNASIGPGWEGIDLRVNLEADVFYAHSRVDLLFDQAADAPTDEERARGYAERTFHVTAEQAWHLGVCADCDLPLPLHPDDRRKHLKRRYCREARRLADG